MKGESLEQLLKSHKITQRTYDRVTVAKEYIEKKYNLKSIINTKWNNIIEKLNSMNINEKEKNKIIDEINHQKSLKSRKNREKQTIREYESLSIIGRGAFGEVHVCREIKTGNIYAIKKIKKETLIKKNQIIHIRSEQLFMSKVKSPWIVDLKASFQEGDYLYLVMEFLPGGDLMNLLIKKDILTEDEARFYIAELILAVDSIHKLDCIHRDIKPDNVLIDKNGHIKLSDFGLAKVSDKLYENYKYENFNKNKLTHKKNYSCVGTAYYVAPEVLNKSGYGKDIDWWSVGVIFFEMLVGYAPFCSEETKEVCYKVINWPKFLKIPDDIKISKEAEDLIFKMINNSDKRLGRSGIEEIKVHPFFKGLDWDNIRSQKAPFIPDIKNDYDTKYFEHFEVEEPFYPPQQKIKRRKDIEFLGYTYKDDNDAYDYDKDINEINEVYKEIMKKYENENKEKTNTTLSQSKDKTGEKAIKKNNTYIKVGEHNIDGSKIMLQKNNSKNIVTMKKKSNNLKIGLSSRNKGKSPPLFSKININKSQISNQQQPKMPLKKIKIADKKNANLNKTFNKSENNSKNKYVKMNVNKTKNKMRLSPLNNNKKLDNSLNTSQKRIIGNKMQNASFKKATSLKNVKDDGTKEMNFTINTGKRVYGLNELNNKIMVVKKIV
jgi:serine/threonine kinase 38